METIHGRKPFKDGNYMRKYGIKKFPIKRRLKEGVAERAQRYLQPHYSNGVLGNIYLSAGQHKGVNTAGTPLV